MTAAVKLGFTRLWSPLFPQAVQWMAGAGHHSFSIIAEPEGGFSATSKDQTRMLVPCEFIPNDTHNFATFDEAVAACEAKAATLKAKPAPAESFAQRARDLAVRIRGSK